MIVVGHQPQYMPYLGIFNKIAKANKFVFADNLQYARRTWQNKTLIKSNDGREITLTVPVQHGNFYADIKDIKVDGHSWCMKHLKSIRLNYSKTKDFDHIFPFLENIISKQNTYLVDYTIPLMMEFIGLLKINSEIYYGSELEITGEKTELLIDILNKTDCDIYLSGEGAKNYFDKDVFIKNHKKHKFNNFVHPKYFQGYNGFTENLSIIDMFFYNGIEKSVDIFWENINSNNLFEEKI